MRYEDIEEILNDKIIDRVIRINYGIFVLFMSMFVTYHFIFIDFQGIISCFVLMETMFLIVVSLGILVGVYLDIKDGGKI